MFVADTNGVVRLGASVFNKIHPPRSVRHATGIQCVSHISQEVDVYFIWGTLTHLRFPLDRFVLPEVILQRQLPVHTPRFPVRNLLDLVPRPVCLRCYLHVIMYCDFVLAGIIIQLSRVFRCTRTASLRIYLEGTHIGVGHIVATADVFMIYTHPPARPAHQDTTYAQCALAGRGVYWLLSSRLLTRSISPASLACMENSAGTAGQLAYSTRN